MGTGRGARQRRVQLVDQEAGECERARHEQAGGDPPGQDRSQRAVAPPVGEAHRGWNRCSSAFS